MNKSTSKVTSIIVAAATVASYTVSSIYAQ